MRTGAEVFVDGLEQYGVTRVFGNPGTTELPVVEAIGESELEYVLGLHEDVAVGMAAGYAKTRRYHAEADSSITPIGVVNLHVAPGLAHGLGNLFDSSLIGAGVPMLVTAGDHPVTHQLHEPNLGAELVRMADQFTKWSAEVSSIEMLPTMLRRAFRVALTPPTGPVFLSLPMDAMLGSTEIEIERLGPIPSAGKGDPEQVSAGAEQLTNATEPVLVVGDGLARSGSTAVDRAVRFAEVTGVRVHGELKGGEISFPTAHPQWAGKLPRDQARVAKLLDVDTVVFAGVISNTPTNPPEFEFIPPAATRIHISDHPWEVGKNEIADVALIGDPGSILDQLTDRLAGRIEADTLESRLARVAAVRDDSLSNDVTHQSDDPRASASQLAAAIRMAAEDARVIVEAPTSTKPVLDAWSFGYGDFFKNRGGGLGWGLPAAIGSAVAEAETGQPRTTIAFIGDGSYLYYSNAIYSAARYGIDLTVVVADNRNYRILKNNAMRIMGGDEADFNFTGLDFEPPVDIPTTAEGHGANARLVDEPAAIDDEVAAAVEESGPTVLDVLIHD